MFALACVYLSANLRRGGARANTGRLLVLNRLLGVFIYALDFCVNIRIVFFLFVVETRAQREEVCFRARRPGRLVLLLLFVRPVISLPS